MHHKVAVYGSLLKGLGNHRLLERTDSKFIDNGVVYGMELYAYAGMGFPCIAEGDGKVLVEVYEVDDNGLLHLDRLEGYPSFYNRKEVRVTLKNGSSEDVWIYYHEQAPDLRVISSGDWKQYLEENR